MLITWALLRYSVDAVIRLIKFWPMSVLDSSKAPATIVPVPLVPAVPTMGRPESTPAEYKFWPCCSSPWSLANCASCNCPKSRVTPLEKTPVIRPLPSIVKLLRVPVAEPSCRLAARVLLLTDRPETAEKLRLNCRGYAALPLRPIEIWSFVTLVRLPWPSNSIRPVPTAIELPVAGWLFPQSAVPAIDGAAGGSALQHGVDGDIQSDRPTNRRRPRSSRPRCRPRFVSC